MLVEFIIKGLLTPVVFLVNLMPTFTLPTFLTNSAQLESLATQFGGYLGMGDYWFPIHEAVRFLPIYVAAVIAYYVWAGVKWAIRLVRG